MIRRVLYLCLVVSALAGCATTAVDEPRPQPAFPGEPASADPQAGPVQGETWIGPGAVVEALGVQLKGVRLSANGYIVDVRYRVLDPAKAQPLLDRRVRPVLVDEATGDRFYVPMPPIIGALRQTSRNKVIHTDRDYFMLFANPDRRLKAGAKVALYLGEQRFGNLRVEAESAVASDANSGARTVAR